MILDISKGNKFGSKSGETLAYGSTIGVALGMTTYAVVPVRQLDARELLRVAWISAGNLQHSASREGPFRAAH